MKKQALVGAIIGIATFVGALGGPALASTHPFPVPTDAPRGRGSLVALLGAPVSTLTLTDPSPAATDCDESVQSCPGDCAEDMQSCPPDIDCTNMSSESCPLVKRPSECGSYPIAWPDDHPCAW